MKYFYIAKYYIRDILNNLKDSSLFMVLFSVIAMTVQSSYSSNTVVGDQNFNAQAQVIEPGQQQPQSSSQTTPPQMQTMPAIKITSHSSGQQVKAGPLTISGTSSDTPSTNCEVYADWNDNMPFGKAIAAGPGGPDDYSKWTFTYDSGYRLIQNGTNNLTSKISCVDGPTNLTKWNSVNLIGVDGLPPTVGSEAGSTINQAITTSLSSSPPSSPISPAMGLSEPATPPPTPTQPGLASSPLSPIVGEEEVEDDEGNGNDENDESESDDSNNDNEDDDNNEDDENNNDSENEDSGDDGNEGDGDGGGDNDDNGDDDNGDSDGSPVDFGPDGPVDFGPDGPVD